MPDFRKLFWSRMGRISLLDVFALAMCVIVLAETRYNHQWHGNKMDDIKEAKAQEFYHPIMNVDDNYNAYGKAVHLMLNDPATSFWFISRGSNLYAPVAINHYLYPDHQIRMSQKTQEEIARFWLYGIHESFRHYEPQNYDKAIEASSLYTQFREQESDEN